MFLWIWLLISPLGAIFFAFRLQLILKLFSVFGFSKNVSTKEIVGHWAATVIVIIFFFYLVAIIIVLSVEVPFRLERFLLCEALLINFLHLSRRVRAVIVGINKIYQPLRLIMDTAPKHFRFCGRDFNIHVVVVVVLDVISDEIASLIQILYMLFTFVDNSEDFLAHLAQALLALFLAVFLKNANVFRDVHQDVVFEVFRVEKRLVQVAGFESVCRLLLLGFVKLISLKYIAFKILS